MAIFSVRKRCAAAVCQAIPDPMNRERFSKNREKNRLYQRMSKMLSEDRITNARNFDTVSTAFVLVGQDD
jgi:hypothetical protein